MSGPLPPVLYKYLPLEYAIAMVNRGEVMFSTLAWFQNLEDLERGDGLEGAHKYFPVGGLEITRTARDGQDHPPVTFTRPNDSLQSKAKGSDHIFIYSTSLREGLTQFNHGTMPSVCVEIHNPVMFLARLRAVLRLTAKAKIGTLIHDKVGYYSFQGPPGNIYALPHRLTMHKHDGFREQQEYRIAFGIRKNVFDFQHIDYHLVGEGIPRPTQILDETYHRWKLRLGSLEHCSRVL